MNVLKEVEADVKKARRKPKSMYHKAKKSLRVTFGKPKSDGMLVHGIGSPPVVKLENTPTFVVPIIVVTFVEDSAKVASLPGSPDVSVDLANSESIVSALPDSELITFPKAKVWIEDCLETSSNFLVSYPEEDHVSTGPVKLITWVEQIPEPDSASNDTHVPNFDSGGNHQPNEPMETPDSTASASSVPTSSSSSSGSWDLSSTETSPDPSSGDTFPNSSSSIDVGTPPTPLEVDDLSCKPLGAVDEKEKEEEDDSGELINPLILFDCTDWFMRHLRLDSLVPIGKGGFGTVWKATGFGGKKYAVKVVQRIPGFEHLLRQEIKTLTRARKSSWVAKLDYWQATEDVILFVTVSCRHLFHELFE